MDGLTDWINENQSAYYAIVMGIMFLSAFLMITVQKKFHGTFTKFSALNSGSGLTGGQVAQKILKDNGITNIRVLKGDKPFMDHYNPTKGVIVLSPANYDSSSVSAIAVAAHEVGHAIQWHNNWFGIKIRNFFLAPAQLGSQLGWITFFMGMIFGAAPWGSFVMWTGLILIGMVSVFQLVTLPVEFNASSRALKILKTDGYIEEGTEGYAGAKKVLSAAAWTYVIGLVVSLLSLLRLVLIMARRR